MSAAKDMVRVLEGLQQQIVVLMNRSTVLEQIVDEQDTTLATCRNLLLTVGVSQEQFEAERQHIAQEKDRHEEKLRKEAEDRMAVPLPDLTSARMDAAGYPQGTFIFGGDQKN